MEPDPRQTAERRLWWAWKRHQLARELYDGSRWSRAQLRAALIELEVAEAVAIAVVDVTAPPPG